MQQEKAELLWIVFNLKLVQENPQNLWRRHGAIDADVGDGGKGWGEDSRLGKQYRNNFIGAAHKKINKVTPKCI